MGQGTLSDENAGTLAAGDTLHLRVIDGMEPQLVKVFRVEPGIRQCNPARHCACHGSEPFYCCRCGMAFVIVE